MKTSHLAALRCAAKACAFAAVCLLQWLARRGADALLFCADALELLQSRLRAPRRVR